MAEDAALFFVDKGFVEHFEKEADEICRAFASGLPGVIAVNDKGMIRRQLRLVTALETIIEKVRLPSKGRTGE